MDYQNQYLNLLHSIFIIILSGLCRCWIKLFHISSMSKGAEGIFYDFLRFLIDARKTRGIISYGRDNPSNTTDGFVSNARKALLSSWGTMMDCLRAQTRSFLQILLFIVHHDIFTRLHVYADILSHTPNPWWFDFIISRRFLINAVAKLSSESTNPFSNNYVP